MKLFFRCVIPAVAVSMGLVPLSALAIGPDAVPSKTLVDDLQSSSRSFSSFFDSTFTSSTAREELFGIAWGLANESSPVDNRAYLYALAIDLYNSLETDTTHCRPTDREAAEGDANEMWWMECGKIGMHFQIDKRLHPEKYGGLKRWRLRGPITEITPGIEQAWLRQYLRNGVDNGSIHLDEYTAPPSLDAASLDLTNPTLYQDMRRYMAAHVTAILAGVAPWKAEQWMAAHATEIAARQVSEAALEPPNGNAGTAPRNKTGNNANAADQQPVNTPPPTNTGNPTSDPPAKMPPWPLIAAVAAAIVAVIIALRRRRDSG